MSVGAPPFPVEMGRTILKGMAETAKLRRRWFHFTPDCVLLALLPVWGMLLLLKRLLNQHFDCFQQVYDERFAAKYGFWRPIVAGRLVKDIVA